MPVVAIFGNYSADYSHLPFRVTTVTKNGVFRATIVAENGNKLLVWDGQKLFDLIRFEMENHYSHSTNEYSELM